MGSSYTPPPPPTTELPEAPKAPLPTYSEVDLTRAKIERTNETLTQTYYFNKAYLDALQEQVAMQTNQTIDYELSHFWSQLDNFEQAEKNTLSKIQVSQGSGITAGNSKALAVQRFLTKAETDKANAETNFLNNLSSYADKQRKQMQDIWGREVMKWKEISTDLISPDEASLMLQQSEYKDAMMDYERQVRDYQLKVDEYNRELQLYQMGVQQEQQETGLLFQAGSLLLPFIF